MASAFWSSDKSRKIKTRVVVEGDLVLQTPTHFGNGDGDDLTDMPLLCDLLDGKTPLLTGASIAGALRSYLREREHNYRQPANQTSASVLLFGGLKSHDEGEQSPLIVDDALGQDSGIEMRDGVQLDSRTRTAADKTKFDLQLWQAGTTFPLRFELLIREGDDASKLKQALLTALTGLTDGSITLGARKRRGYGRVDIRQWRAKAYDLTKIDSLFDWIEHGNEPLSAQCIVTDLPAAFGGQQSLTDVRTIFTIQATFSLDGSLLIRSGSGRDDFGPDTEHLHTRQPDGSRKPVLSGTSLGGALRARALKIANTLGRAKATELIGQMFGLTDLASKVRVSEQVVQNATTNLVQNRVSIDRFTGGARDTALFNEQPAFGDDDTLLTVEIQLIKPEPHEIGLLLLLLKDLWTSDLPLGGESSVGRGRLKGKSATLTYRNGGAPQTWAITDNGQGLSVSNDREALGKYVKAHLKNYFNSQPQEVAR